jgi:hypothetical protein
MHRLRPDCGLFLWAQVDAQREDAVHELGLGVADHGVIGEVALGLLAEALAFGPLDGRNSPGPYRLGALTEAGHHLVRIEHGHQRRPGRNGRQQRRAPVPNLLGPLSHYTGPAVIEVLDRTRGRDGVRSVPG